MFRVQYAGAETITDGRVVLFFAPAATPEPRLEAFELEDLRPLFAKDVVRDGCCAGCGCGTTRISHALLPSCVADCSKTCSQGM